MGVVVSIAVVAGIVLVLVLVLAKRAHPQRPGKGLHADEHELLVGWQMRTDDVVIRVESCAALEVLQPGDDTVPLNGRHHLLGLAAVEASAETKRPARSLLPGGAPPADGGDRDLLGLMLAVLVQPPTRRGEVLYFTTPSKPLAPGEPAPDDVARRLGGLLAELGYAAKPIEAAHAAVFGELDEVDFTGLAVHAGRSRLDACLCFRTLPAASRSTRRGALADGAPLSAEWKAALADLLAALAADLRAHPEQPDWPQPIPVVVTGALADREGVAAAVEAALAQVDLGLQVGRARVVDDPRTSVVRGALVAAAADDDTPQG